MEKKSVLLCQRIDFNTLRFYDSYIMKMFLSIEVSRLRYGKMLAEDNDRKTLVLRKVSLQVF